jgi:signal transduction histidine kinase
LCSDIIQALILKACKEIKVAFQAIKENNLPNYIKTDETKLKQILINLLSNAGKYTYRGSIYSRIAFEGSELKFQIVDTGMNNR